MNYIGSKSSLMIFLNQTITDVTGYEEGKDKVFADLFAGTGVVGSTYKEKNYEVISNDIQYYSYILNKHFIENMLPIDSSKLDYLNSLNGIDGFIYKNYCAGSGSGRNYFTDENGKKCDHIRVELEKMKDTGEITNGEYYYYLASLINSIDKYANTTSVYGAFLKQLKQTAKKSFKLELLPVISGTKAGKAYNENTTELIKNIEGDILYLDPPYNARQYCSNYHVLETIARYDNPTLRGLTGLRDYSTQKSEFCSKRTVDYALDVILKNANFKYIFLSYNNEGLMSLETIRKVMEKYGKYDMFTTEYRRFKSDKTKNRNHKYNSTTEYLHCLRK